MRAHKYIVTLLSIGVFSLSGCQQFSTVRIHQDQKQLVFDVSPIGKDIDGDKQYILYDIGLSKSICPADSCVVWEIVRNPDYFNRLDYPIDNNLIYYGKVIPGTKTTVSPQPLTTGEYTMAASVGLILDERLYKSYKIFQNFRLSVSKTGELTVFPSN